MRIMPPIYVIIACPPYPQYENAPEDQSHCELFECPKCKEKMWLSEKKKGVLTFASCLNKKIILACYNCIKLMADNDPELFYESINVEL